MVSTIAGGFGKADGIGSNAQFLNPIGLAIDTSSNMLYIADAVNKAIRALETKSA